MLNKYIFTIVLLSVLAMFCTLGHAQQSLQNDTKMSKQQILDLLPRHHGDLDERHLQNLKQLLKMGESTYSALSEELLNTDDVFTASSIFYIFSESKGDKTIPLKAVRKLTNKWKDSSTYEGRSMRIDAARALGEFGTKEDNAILLSFLEDQEQSVRHYSLESLAKIGDEKTMQKVETWLAKRKAAVNQTEIEKAVTARDVQDAEKTIEILRTRVKKSPQK